MIDISGIVFNGYQTTLSISYWKSNIINYKKFLQEPSEVPSEKPNQMPTDFTISYLIFNMVLTGRCGKEEITFKS